MFKISHVHEVPKITGIPQEVIDVAESIVDTLDRVYGADRDPLLHDGGYVVVLEPEDDLSVLEEIELEVDRLCPEYTDYIRTSAGVEYFHSLILFNNEFSCHIIGETSKASVNLL